MHGKDLIVAVRAKQARAAGWSELNPHQGGEDAAEREEDEGGVEDVAAADDLVIDGRHLLPNTPGGRLPSFVNALARLQPCPVRYLGERRL